MVRHSRHSTTKTPPSLTCSPWEPGRCEGGRLHGQSSELAPAAKEAVALCLPRRRRLAHFRALGRAASCSKLLEVSTLKFGPELTVEETQKKQK